MSKAELLYGQRPLEAFSEPPSQLDLSASENIALDDVEISYSLFEVPMDTVQHVLPAALHPSVPAVFGATFWRVPASPFGPFALSYVGPACRTGIKPRHMVTAAWCDNEQAGSYMSANYGFSFTKAEILCRETYDRIHSSVVVDGRSILDITTTDCVPLVGAGATVKYSPSLNLTRFDDRLVFAQFEAAYTFKRVLRGIVQNNQFDPNETGDVELVPNYPIAGTYAVCDVQLLPVRFAADPVVPAEQGGAIKLSR